MKSKINRDEKLDAGRYGNANVLKEATERKSGGKVKGHDDDCMCKRCYGGKAMKRKAGGKAMGEKAEKNMGRPARKSGGKLIYGKPLMSMAGKEV